MCHVDCVWHVFFYLVGSITKLDSLVTSSNRVKLVLIHLILFLLKCFINTHCNISRLFIKCCDYRTCISIESEFSTSITNLADCLSYD